MAEDEMQDQDQTRAQLVDELAMLRRQVTDLQARLRAAEVLRESEDKYRRVSEARYRILFEQAGEAIHIDNANDEIVDVNRRACEMFGYSRKELLGMKVPDLQAPEVRGQVGNVVRTEMARHGNTVFESVDVRRDGTRIPVEVNVSKVTGLEDELYISIVRDTTDRVRAEEAFRQRSRELAELNALIGTITSTLSLEQVLQRIIAALPRFVKNAGDTTVQLLDESEGLSTRAVSEDIAGGSPQMVFYAGQGIAGWALEECRPINVPDVTLDPRFLPGDCPASYRSLLVIPLISHEQVLGTLSVSSAQVGAFDEKDEQLLLGLSGYAAIAIRNARLYEETQRRSLERETVSRVARALNTLDVRDAFPVLVEGLQDLTGCDRVSLALLDAEGERLEMSILESPFPALEEGTALPLAITAVADDIRVGRLHLTADLRAEADFPDERALYEAGFRSRVNLPLIAGRRPIGALNLASCQLDAFQEGQLPVLQQIADALAGAVENGRLFRAEQQQRQEADTLREAALALTAALDRDQVIARILAQLQQVVPYDSSSVQLLRKGTEPGVERDQLQIVGGRGFRNLPDLMSVSFPIGGHNPNSEVVHTRASVIVEDAPAVYEAFRRTPHSQTKIHSWLGVPMLIGQQLIGMIALDKREPGFYTPEHTRLAEAFAAQAAIAIENARLYEQAQRDAETRAMLLQEVNHRVKNNLTAIMGFLALETERPDHKGTDLQFLHELQGRIQGLVTVHDLLSEVQWSPLPLGELVERVIGAALSGSPIHHQIEVAVTSPSPVESRGMAERVTIAPRQATGLALVVNEFTTNSIKHAFRDRECGRIDVRIDVEDADEQAGMAGSREVMLEFCDDGPGWPEDVLRGERESVGLSIVRATVRSPLLGRLVLENGDVDPARAGAIAKLTFRLVPAD